MLERKRMTPSTIIDLIKLGCGGLLIAAGSVLGTEGMFAWNAFLSGYAIFTAALAALVAEADWEPQANLVLGCWATVSPLCVGTLDVSAAALIHVIGGAVVGLLSAVELWSVRRDPPWRFQPGSASRSVLMTPVMAHADHRGPPVPIYGTWNTRRGYWPRHNPFGSGRSGAVLQARSRERSRTAGTSGVWRQPHRMRRRSAYCSAPRRGVNEQVRA
jgi:SPW repeat